MTKPQAPKTLTIASAVLAVAMTAAGGAAFADTYDHSTHAPRHHSKIALQCSEEANLKGLHGKARQEFRRHCIREHTASNAPAHHVALKYDHPAHKAVLKSTTPKAKTDKTT